MLNRRQTILFVVPALVGALFGACNYNNVRPRTVPSRSTVGVQLREFQVVVEKSPLPSGSITFRVRNLGPKNNHEFVVAKTALAPNKLPTLSNGSVNEDGPGITLLGELAAFGPGKTMSKTFDLAKGNYVLFCNRVESTSGKRLVHYKLGMRIGLNIT
ncbi:MAG: hypothetical protein WAT66_11925 [Actinomycetota bacterium]